MQSVGMFGIPVKVSIDDQLGKDNIVSGRLQAIINCHPITL